MFFHNFLSRGVGGVDGVALVSCAQSSIWLLGGLRSCKGDSLGCAEVRKSFQCVSERGREGEAFCRHREEGQERF